MLSGVSAAAVTFIFSFSEIFGGYANMPGGLADTLLALLWTQYLYVVFPLVFGYIASNYGKKVNCKRNTIC